MKMKASRSDHEGEDDEQEGQESGVVDDATEKRNEDVSVSASSTLASLTSSQTANSLEEKVKQIIDEIKVLECRVKALGEIISVLQQEEQVASIVNVFILPTVDAEMFPYRRRSMPN